MNISVMKSFNCEKYNGCYQCWKFCYSFRPGLDTVFCFIFTSQIKNERLSLTSENMDFFFFFLTKRGNGEGWQLYG